MNIVPGGFSRSASLSSRLPSASDSQSTEKTASDTQTDSAGSNSRQASVSEPANPFQGLDSRRYSDIPRPAPPLYPHPGDDELLSAANPNSSDSSASLTRSSGSASEISDESDMAGGRVSDNGNTASPTSVSADSRIAGRGQSADSSLSIDINHRPDESGLPAGAGTEIWNNPYTNTPRFPNEYLEPRPFNPDPRPAPDNVVAELNNAASPFSSGGAHPPDSLADNVDDAVGVSWWPNSDDAVDHGHVGDEGPLNPYDPVNHGGGNNGDFDDFTSKMKKLLDAISRFFKL